MDEPKNTMPLRLMVYAGVVMESVALAHSIELRTYRVKKNTSDERLVTVRTCIRFF